MARYIRHGEITPIDTKESNNKRLRKRDIASMEYTIYALSFKNVDGIYIGATMDFTYRTGEHIRQLMEGTHKNPRLLAKYREAGELPICTALEVFNAEYAEDICDKEIQWMHEVVSEHDRDYLLNHSLDSQPSSFKYLPRRPVVATGKLPQ